MKILRHYQLDIIFLFLSFLLLMWTGLYLLQDVGGRDAHQFEWLLGGPVIALYVAMLVKIRSHISLGERRKLTGQTLVYWIALGIILFESYAAPLPATEFWSINLLFIVFTIFLADSYWDFRKLVLRNIFRKEQ